MKKNIRMMKRSLLSVWFFLCIFLAGCEEQIDIDAVEYVSDAIVVDGLVTNEALPYFFRLTKPVGLSENNKSLYEGIDDAKMVLTDVTEDVKDTLALVPSYQVEWGRTVFHYYNYFTQTKDTLWVHEGNVGRNAGVYITTKIRGTEGHSYTLDIYHDGKQYQSDVQKMEPALNITDMKYQLVDLGEKGKSPAPCISFTNPQGPNYYLFYHYPYSYVTCDGVSQIYRLFGGKDGWSYSIVKDDYLEEDVKDFIIADGENAYGYGPGWNYWASDSLYVWAQTISKSCYDVYHQMIDQLRTDGGAYTPTPTNIKSNISGGNVYGCFRVSAISEKGVKVKEL